MNEYPPIEFYYFAVAIAALLIILFSANIYARANDREYRYRFFALRDRLIWLRATGKIQEDSIAFQFLYGYLNQVIPHIDLLQWRSITRIAREELTPEDQVSIRLVIDDVVRSDASVRELTNDLYLATKEIVEKKNRFALFWAEFATQIAFIDKYNSLWIEPYKVVVGCDSIIKSLLASSLQTSRLTTTFQH